MPKYFVYATEKVCYQIKVEANSEEEAHKKVMDGEYFAHEAIDGEDFNIFEIEEEKDA
jgi:hypothetical protein